MMPMTPYHNAASRSCPACHGERFVSVTGQSTVEQGRVIFFMPDWPGLVWIGAVAVGATVAERASALVGGAHPALQALAGVGVFLLVLVAAWAVWALYRRRAWATTVSLCKQCGLLVCVPPQHAWPAELADLTPFEPANMVSVERFAQKMLRGRRP
jgi:hypothetical protein